MHPLRSIHKHEQLAFVRDLRHCVRDVLGVCRGGRVLLDHVERMQLCNADRRHRSRCG